MTKAVTLQDIANEAGVSKATVSMALRGDKRIHVDTRTHICEVARRLKYKPNAAMAKLMAQVKAYQEEGYHGNLGMIHVDKQLDIYEKVPTYGQWVSGARRQAARRGYQVEDFWLRDPHVTTDRLVGIMKSRGIEGILVPATCGYKSMPGEFSEIWNNFSCVVIGIRNRDPVMHYASNDQYTTVFDAVKKARDLGYQRVGMAMMDTVDKLVDYKFTSGFETARNVMGMNVDVPTCYYHRTEDSPVVVKEWYSRHKPDVIICIDYMLKLWLEDMGCTIPSDVGLIALDCHETADDWAGMNQRNDLVGEAAVELLIRQVQFDEIGPPKNPTCTQVTSVWKDGGSVVQQASLEIAAAS